MRTGPTDLNPICEKFRSARLGDEASFACRARRDARTIRAHIQRGAVMALSEFPRLSFDPFTELRRMQSEMNRVFSGFSTATARDFPPINIWLGENRVVVTAELAGVPADDVNLNLQEDVLMLGGKREPKTRQETVNVASGLTALSPAPSSCPFGSIPIRSRRASITGYWRSSWSGSKQTVRKKSKFAAHEI